MKYKIAIVDDHPLFRGALRVALTSKNNIEIMEAGDLESAKELVQSSVDIDLVLLDLSLNGVGGLLALFALRTLRPSLPIAVVSATDDPVTIRRALALGAAGYIVKSASPEEIKRAVRAVLNGEIWSPLGSEEGADLDTDLVDLIRCMGRLTPQQGRVLDMMARGMLNKQIAHELNVSEATVKAHVSAVLFKLGVESRTQAVIRLARFKEDPQPPDSAHTMVH